MLDLSMDQPPDCTGRNLSIGYWQASRIQALIGIAQETSRHARTCVAYCAILEPFYLGDAYEPLARGAGLMNDAENLADYLDRVEALAEQVTDEQNHQLLAANIAQLRIEPIQP